MPSDEDLIADALFRLTVAADAGDGAGRSIAKTLLIHRRSHRTGTLHSRLQCVHDLIHAGDDDNGFRAVDDGRHPVAGAVDIDHLAIQA